MKIINIFSIMCLCLICNAQTEPIITEWLQNTTTFASYYTEATGSTPIPMTDLANVQEVCYETNLGYVYVTTEGLPTYPTGIFTGDGNTNLAGAQDVIYRFPLTPTPNTGTPTETTLDNNGVFINGVSLFDWQDGVKWNPNTNDICGGPPGLNDMCPMGLQADWNRDAVPAESEGFDCAKGHPAGAHYHHHQNPSPFIYDGSSGNTYSDICDDYPSDALYIIDPTQHSPLIGFAYDGYPIYGAYAYANTDGTGGIVRMKSSYELTTNTTRVNGPDIMDPYFNGYFKEDYVYVSNSASDYLDEHNGRFAETPEYPGGTYAYYATVKDDYNSAFPYLIGPTFYGEVTAITVTSKPSTAIVYNAVLPIALLDFEGFRIEDKVVLKWETVSEINNDYFEIQRSVDGISFESIGNVKGNGNSNTLLSYEYIDKNPLSETSYYRLTQFDYDGSFEHSKTVAINDDNKSQQATVYHDHSSSMLLVQNIGLSRYDTDVNVFDVNGKRVKSTKILSGSTAALIDTQLLYEGIYFVIVSGIERSNSFKVYISK